MSLAPLPWSASLPQTAPFEGAWLYRTRPQCPRRRMNRAPICVVLFGQSGQETLETLSCL